MSSSQLMQNFSAQISVKKAMFQPLLAVAAMALPLMAAPMAMAQNDQSADPTAANAQGDVALTIYNSDDMAVVQDVRQIHFQKGVNIIEFPDVAARIVPTTLSFRADNTNIIEQNFDYDLLSPSKLMEKAVGETITIIRTNPATGAETRQRAKVLSVNNGVVLQIGNQIEVMRDDGLPVRAVFDKIPDNLRAKPTLSAKIDSSNAATKSATIRYMTSGMKWNADYVALFDDQTQTMDVQGWVTINNNSGTAYKNADIMLVAGDPDARRYRGNNGMVEAGIETANRERLGDYYLYPMGRTHLAENQTKQIGFLDVQNVPAKKGYRYNVGWFQNQDEPQSVDSVISFSSSAKGGLGDALPAGNIIFYQKDQRGTPQFIGAQNIGHTPMGSTLSLKTGEAFDVKVKTTVVKREKLGKNKWRSSMSYELSNARDQAVTVSLTQYALDWGWTETKVIEESQQGQRLNSNGYSWDVVVPANGKATVTAVYETRY